MGPLPPQMAPDAQKDTASRPQGPQTMSIFCADPVGAVSVAAVRFVHKNGWGFLSVDVAYANDTDGPGPCQGGGPFSIRSDFPGGGRPCRGSSVLTPHPNPA